MSRQTLRPWTVALLLTTLFGVAIPAQLHAQPESENPSETPPESAQPDSTQSESAQSESAEENAIDPPRARFRQELIVTSSAPELPAGSALPGRAIERAQARDVVEYLRDFEGMSAVRRGPIGLDPQVRGAQEGQVGMFVDGTRTFAAGPGRMDSDLSHVSPHAVERMEVVKGPYALTWGSGAITAVRLETLRPSFGDGGTGIDGRAGVSWGDNTGDQDTWLDLGTTTERWRARLVGNARSGDDYEPGGGGGKVPADYTSRDLRWSLGWRPSESTLVDYTGGYQEQKDVDYAGRLLDATYFHTRSHALEMSAFPGSSGLQVYGQLYSNRKDHRMNNDEKPTAQPNANRMPPFAIAVDLPAESDTTGGRLYAEGGGGAWSGKVGLDAYRLEQTASRTVTRRDNGMVLFRDIVWPNARQDDLGLYAQGIRRGDGWSVAVTLRGDLIDTRAGEVSPFFADGVAGPLDADDSHLGVAVNARRAVGHGWSLSAGAGQVDRTPSILERYSDRFPSTRFQIAAEFLGDPGLKAETARQFDLGVAYASGDLTFQASGFYRSIADYITVTQDPDIPKRLPLSPPIVYRYVNGDDGVFWGGEARVDHRIGRRLSWRASASWVRGEDTLFDEPAFGMPPLTLRAGARWSADAWWLDLGLTVAERQDRVAAARDEIETPGWTTADVTGGRTLGRWTLRGGVENVADERYADHLNTLDPFTGERILEPGRTVRLGVEVAF